MLHDRLTRGRLMSQPIERFGVISGMIELRSKLLPASERVEVCAQSALDFRATAWDVSPLSETLNQPCVVP